MLISDIGKEDLFPTREVYLTANAAHEQELLLPSFEVTSGNPRERVARMS